MMCHNCKYASRPFKLGGLTHHVCDHPKLNPGFESGELSPWDAVRAWYEGCEDYELKENKK